MNPYYGFCGNDPEGQPGYYEINFDALNLASGIYLYRIKAVPQAGGDNYISTKKLILVK